MNRLMGWLRQYALALFWVLQAVLWVVVLFAQYGVWPVNAIALVGLLMSLIALFVHCAWEGTLTKRGLLRLAQDIHNRDVYDFSALCKQGITKEIHPLVDTLNHFLQREAEQAKQEHTLTSEASHELRTPLAGMRLQAQLAQRTQDPKQREKSLSLIVKAIDRSTHLVEQLLLLSRYTHLQQAPQSKVVSLSQLVDQLQCRHQSLLDERNILLESNWVEALPTLLSFEEGISDWVDHVFINALHHTPANGVIRLVAKRTEANRLTLSILDSGSGVPEGDYSRIQTPFQKTKNGEKQGSGLGLAIVNRIAHVHGSELVLERSELGGLKVSASFAIANAP